MKLTPITNPVALRLDTTVGTRIFAGNTMIHGDTGWRNVADLTAPETVVNENVSGGFQVRVRRVGHEVYWVFRFRPHPSQVGSGNSINVISGSMPDGFREDPTLFSQFGSAIYGANILGINNSPGPSYVSLRNSGSWEDRVYAITGSYTTTRPWPPTLPGLPA